MREFIVEADGGSRGNPGPAGYGSVVLDARTGETLVEAAEYIGVATNNVAEYGGLIAGLRVAHELDPDAVVHVRMDSKLVVEQMSGRWKIKHPDMKPLAAEAARIFPPGRVTYEWIPRAENSRADRLANEAMDAGARGERWTPTRAAAPSSHPPTVTGAREALRDAQTPRAAEAPRTGETPSRAKTPPPSSRRGAAGQGEGRLGDPSTPAHPSRRGAAESLPAERARDDVRAARSVAKAPAQGWSASADLGAPATFVLLRHGETPLTPEKRFSGSGGTDPSLTEAGRAQAHRVAATLAARGTIEAVVTSPMERCRETAEIVAARLGLDVTVEEGLREADFGAWEGLTFAEVQAGYPDDLTTWLASTKAEPSGGGESFATVARRVAVTRDKLVAAYAGRTVLLVTHVTPIKTFVRFALGAPPESLFRMELSAASLSAIAYYADGNASLRLLNDTAHLR